MQGFQQIIVKNLTFTGINQDFCSSKDAVKLSTINYQLSTRPHQPFIQQTLLITYYLLLITSKYPLIGLPNYQNLLTVDKVGKNKGFWRGAVFKGNGEKLVKIHYCPAAVMRKSIDL